MKPATLCLFLFISFFASAQKIRFVARKCVIPKEDQAQIRQMAEHEVAFFKNVFGNKKIPTLRIVVYGDYKEFMNTQKSSPRYARSPAGYFSPARKEICVFKQAGYLQTCFHEMSHAVYHVHCRSISTWINEGLATYFENSKIDSTGKIITYAPKGRKAWMRSYVDEKKFTINPLVNFTYKKFHKRKRHRHYTTSWGIVYYLANRHPEDLYDIMRGLEASKDNAGTIDGIYTGGIAKLNKDLVEYYK